jgi:hypothetical protein
MAIDIDEILDELRRGGPAPSYYYHRIGATVGEVIDAEIAEREAAVGRAEKTIELHLRGNWRYPYRHKGDGDDNGR